MAIETGLRTLLLSQGSIASLVATRPIQQTNFKGIFCEYGEQGFAPPFILIHLIDHDPMVTSGGTSGMGKSEIDIDCHANSVVEALKMADAVADYMKDFVGYAGATDYIDAVLWEGKRIDNIRPGDATNTIQYVASQSFTIFHHEA